MITWQYNSFQANDDNHTNSPLIHGCIYFVKYKSDLTSTKFNSLLYDDKKKAFCFDSKWIIPLNDCIAWVYFKRKFALN